MDTNTYIGCDRCTEVCPHRMFEHENGKAQILDRDYCMECGACAKKLPVSAISVKAGIGCAHDVILKKLFGEEAAAIKDAADWR